MKLQKLVSQGKAGGETLAGAIGIVLAGKNFDRLDVAVAYATRSGIRALKQTSGGFPSTTRWVVGLDDFITQPEAIDDLLSFDDVEVRLATLAPEGRRFHPKMYCFWSSQDANLCVAVIGSANMTQHGLNKNGEVSAILEAENAEDAAQLKAGWQAMWAMGKSADAQSLESYRAAHIIARRAQRGLAKVGGIVMQPEAEETLSTFDGNPATASTAWTECGSPSAGGRDLEFPRALMPFFGLLESPATKSFRAQNGDTFQLKFTERTNNDMWRLMLSTDSIRSAIGRDTLRAVAGGNRSDLAIVFTRAGNGTDYDLRMVLIGSAQHSELLALSQAADGLNRTHGPGGRNFGFY